MPRLYREAPVNSIWEGSGNVNALDVLRAIAREPESLPAFFAEVEAAKGMDAGLDAAIAALKDAVRDPADAESRARSIVSAMAVALQASLMLRHGDPASADLFCRSRLGHDAGAIFGTLKPRREFASVIERHRPRI